MTRRGKTDDLDRGLPTYPSPCLHRDGCPRDSCLAANQSGWKASQNYLRRQPHPAISKDHGRYPNRHLARIRVESTGRGTATSLPRRHHRYIDLSNEQAFLHNKKRVTDEAWTEWSDGIKYNMKLPAFEEVWEQVKEKCPASFKELRVLVA